MNSEAGEDVKVAVKKLAKEQALKLSSYGSFILFSWAIGTVFLYFIQKSLTGDPFRNKVVIFCLIYATLVPLMGSVIYSGLYALVNKNDK